jgi:hypothetical protein
LIEAVAAATVAGTEAADPITGSTGAVPVIAEAGLAALATVPSSRRVTASAVHIKGAAAGASPPELPSSQDDRSAPAPLTEPTAAEARDAAEITGATDAAVGATGEALSSVSSAALGVTAGDDGMIGESVREVLVATEAELPPLRASADAEREPRRGPAGVDDRADDTSAVGELSEALEPVDPEDPVLSANAAGIAAIAEPTPNATASAPTRPTYRA